MASSGAVPFWRAAGMTYITYSNLCASLVRNCLKEPFKSEALAREKSIFLCPSGSMENQRNLSFDRTLQRIERVKHEVFMLL